MLRDAFTGFKAFMLKGDLITAAVGLVMALATYSLVNALVDGLIMPIISAVLGKDDIFALTLEVLGIQFNYGIVLSAALAFLVTAAAVYFLIVVPYKAYQDHRGISSKTRPCPECTSAISVAAKRCPHCTSAVAPEPA